MASWREFGFHAGVVKAAMAIDGILDAVLADVREMTGDATVTAETVLDDVLPRRGDLERLVLNHEQNYGVQLDDGELERIFTGGSVSSLARAISRRVVAEKTASSAMDPQARQRAHARYLTQRPQRLAAAKAWRMAHLQQVRRRAKRYRMRVKRRIHRPKKRVGTAASGYMFIPR